MSRTLSWGILSTGQIAGQFAADLPRSSTGKLAAVASRALDSAQRFAAKFQAARAHASYEELLADHAVDAVYIATPHPHHLEWALKSLRAGKHVLCEKPLALNHEQGLQIIEAAREANVTFMEAFMYRCHPQTAKIVKIVRSGALGEIDLIQANFGFFRPFDAASRVWDPALGGGGILDVGVYPVSMSRLIAGAANGVPFLDPFDLQGAGRLASQTGVDAFAAATLRFPGGIVAQVATAVGLQIDNTLRIYGSKGWLQVPFPWFPAMHGGRYVINRHGANWDPGVEHAFETDKPLYAHEADAFAEAVHAGQHEVSAMPWADTLGNLKAVDKWRADLGVKYPGE